MSASVMPESLTDDQSARYIAIVAGLGRALRPGIDHALVITFLQAEDRYNTAARMQAEQDVGNAAPLLTWSNGRKALSPYLQIMEKASGQMSRAAASLGIRPPRLVTGDGGSGGELPAPQQGPAERPMTDAEAEAEAAALGTVSKRELRLILRCSPPTLDAWLNKYGDDFPVVERGTNGRSWRFDPEAVIAFLRTQQDVESAKKAERDEALAQLMLPLPAADDGRTGISVDERLKVERLNAYRLEMARKAGQLVSAEEVRGALADALGELSRSLRSIGRSVGHDCNLPAHVIRAIETRVADAQRNAVRSLTAYLTAAPAQAEPIQQEAAFG